MADERGLILLRTHFVDARIAGLARAYAAGGDYDVMIAVDETAGEIDAQGWPKLSLSLNTCVRLGLNVAFEAPLVALRRLSVLSRSGAAAPLRPDLVDRVRHRAQFRRPARVFPLLRPRRAEDYLTTFLEEAPPDWYWRRAAERQFGILYSSGFAVVRLSAIAIEKLRQRRRLDAAELAGAELSPGRFWPNDEAFVSSAAPELGLSSADLNAYGAFYTPQTLMRGGVWHPEQLPAPDGRIYHAVRTGASYPGGGEILLRFRSRRLLRLRRSQPAGIRRGRGGAHRQDG